MNDMPDKACWRAEDVSAILNNEALEGHEGVFLATHTPIIGFDVLGSHAGEIEGRDEHAVLSALSDPGRRHAFCVVQGEPGSGKSHLIRWLSVNWPWPNDVKLLLQRADGSLEGALRQLQDRLPPEFKELFDNLGQRHRATVRGRANNFLTNLANALDPDHFDPPLEDVEWCRTHNPTDLIAHREVRQKWNGPSRILRLLEGANQERNSASASFDLFDIEDLANTCHGIYGSGVLPRTEMLAQRLIKEAQFIREYRQNGWSAEEIETAPEAKAQVRVSIELAAALNRRRNDAIQNVLGVSAEGLKRLFRQVREELALRRQRLVLLLEDITSWEGLDDSLIDVLVTNAETRGSDGDRDMCPLISVVGVTPAYYQKLHGNYRGRITHELRLGIAQHDGDLQDVATLRDRTLRLSFAVRYLAAVRTGAAALKGWREQRREDPYAQVPNRCEACSHRSGCHTVFGAQSGVGLFPFTADALERMFSALNERDNGMTWKTPRGILQAVLGPNLSQPQAIEKGAFPTLLLENQALSTDSRRLSRRLSQQIDAAVEGENERSRMRRMLAYWGDKERADTTLLELGELAFSGVPRRIFDTFQLPWIGDNVGTSPNVAPIVVPDPEPAEPISEAPAAPAKPKEGPKPSIITGPTPAPKVGNVPPSRRRTPTKSELERLRDQLRKWADTGELDEPTEWNKTLYSLVQAIDPRRVGLDPFTFRRLVTQERVKIEGTAPGQRNYFSVKLENWVINGFEAHVALRLDKDMSVRDQEFHRQNLATMMRRLERTLSEYVDKRLSLTPDGKRWTPLPSLVQLLLLRAWLRGTVSPDAPPPAQLRAILSDESEATSDPLSRSTPWQEFLNKTHQWHERFRDATREMMRAQQGDGQGFGLLDVSVAAGAITRLRDTFKFDPVPKSDSDVRVIELDRLREIVADTEGSLSRIIQIEMAQIRGRSDALVTNLRGYSIRSHLHRVDQVVDRVFHHLPNAAPDLVRQWKAQLDRLKPRFEASADARVEELMMAFADEDCAPPKRSSPLLGWLAEAPARDLNDFRAAAQVGEELTANLLEAVRDCVREGRGTASLDDIRSVGHLFRNAVQSVHGAEDQP
jgi:hypothetical protein